MMKWDFMKEQHLHKIWKDHCQDWNKLLYQQNYHQTEWVVLPHLLNH